MSRRSYLPAKDLRPPLGNPKQEAAKFLRDMATDFLKERSGENVVTEAARQWLTLVESQRTAPPLDVAQLNRATEELARLAKSLREAVPTSHELAKKR